MNSLAPLLVGIAFGAILQRSGLSRYERIVGIYRLRDATVLEFLGAALLTAAIGIQALVSLGIAGPLPIPSTYLAGNLVGGIVFGVGMALSGFCPGTIAAGAGEGRLDYLIPGAIGLYCGAVVYGLAYESVMPALARGARPATLARVLDAEPWLVVVILAEALALVLYELAWAGHRSPRRL